MSNSLIVNNPLLMPMLKNEYDANEDRVIDRVSKVVQVTDGIVFGEVKITDIGGIAIKLTNNTGAASVKGTIVAPSTLMNGFIVAAADSDVIFGVVLEDGIEEEEDCWIVISGVAEVLLKDTISCTYGDWMRLSAATAGRAGASTTPIEAEISKKIGYSITAREAGTDVLAKVLLQF